MPRPHRGERHAQTIRLPSALHAVVEACSKRCGYNYVNDFLVDVMAAAYKKGLFARRDGSAKWPADEQAEERPATTVRLPLTLFADVVAGAKAAGLHRNAFLVEVVAAAEANGLFAAAFAPTGLLSA